MQCPECRIDLVCEDIATAGVQLDVCRQCNGIWFDPGEINKAIANIIHKPLCDVHRMFLGTLKDHARNRPCPCCSKSMNTVCRHSVELDFCETCRGFWLDSGELMMILQRFGKFKSLSANSVQSVPQELESVNGLLNSHQKSFVHKRKRPINAVANNSGEFGSEAVTEAVKEELTEVAVEVGIEMIFEAIIGFFSS